nr:reverse transcriptase domain-containing protein [Tanacetum cinerariifolium]
MVKEGIVLGHKILKKGIEVDKAKNEVILKLPHPTTVKRIRSFLGHAGFYHRFIKDFSNISRPMTHLLEKNLPFIFSNECIDFMGPFLSFKGNKYILVAIDYLSKWVEAKALPTNDARVVVKFLKSLFSWFGTPKAIISDRGTHFCNDQFSRVMVKYEVTHRLSTTYHPQTSGQVEVTNRRLKRILERTVGENHTSWSDKLEDALWAFRTAFKTSIGCTPYRLVYGKACHLLLKLKHKAYWALKHVNFDLKTTGDHRKLQLNELNELRDQAYENSLIYKEWTKKLHDDKIKNCIFNDYPLMVEDLLCRILSWFPRPSSLISRLSIPVEQKPTGGHYGANYTAKKVFDTVGCTPYRLVYGKACHLPLELEHKAYWALKHANFDLKTACDHRKLQLNELNELRDQAYENSLIYKERTKKLHDDKIKNRIFNVGDQVLLFNSRLKIFSVNCHRLKHYHGGDPPPLEIPDVTTFPKDN